MKQADVSCEALISEYYDAILAHCNYKLNFDTPSAQEITQETFYQLLLHWDRFRTKTEAGLVTWLYKTADVLIKKHFRIQKQERKLFWVEDTESPCLQDPDFRIDKNIITQEENALYEHYIDTIKKNLTEKELLIFEHIIQRKYTVAQTAHILGMKENTVMISLYRLRKKAKKIINRYFPDITENEKGGQA